MKLSGDQLNTRNRATRRPAKQGQAAVEFALVLVVFVALLYGILEIARLMLINADLENAAREGAKYASIHPGVPPDCIKSKAVDPKLTILRSSELPAISSLDRRFLDGGIAPSLRVQVAVTYTWTSMINIVPDMSRLSLSKLGPYTLRATAIRNIEVADPHSDCPIEPGQVMGPVK